MNKKRYKKLWRNTIPLRDYKGSLDINLIMFYREGRNDMKKREFYSKSMDIITREEMLNGSLKVLTRNVILNHENVDQNWRIVNVKCKQSIITST
jgi:hypothetical protein